MFITNPSEIAIVKDYPLVSIVTPAYNQGQYLAETIDSVLSQDYPNIEYIVIDDGSTDTTPEVLERYIGRIRWERQENAGQAATLNRAWEMSAGVLLGYLSSDDVLHPQAVRKLVEALTAQPNMVVSYCDFDLMDATGRCFRRVSTEEFDVERLRVDLVCQPGPGALFRRAAFHATGGWAKELKQVPDFEFWLRVSSQGGFTRVAHPLAKYRIHDSSASYRHIERGRSDEIVRVMTSYWNADNGIRAQHSLANAHLIAAKNHAQSGRIRESVSHWYQAIKARKQAIYSLKAWRLILSGFFRKFLY